MTKEGRRERGSEQHKLWLFDLCHGNLTAAEAVAGFTRFYTLEGYDLNRVNDDLVNRTGYLIGSVLEGVAALEIALEEVAGEYPRHGC